MAESVQFMRHSHNVRLRFWMFLALDLVIILSLLIATFTVLWLNEDLRIDSYTALGYGWIPAVLWAVTVLAALRYRPRWLFRFWNWWLAGAVAAILAVGVLAFFDAEYGKLAFVGLSGRWGSAIIGEKTLWGMLRLLPLVLTIPLLLAPSRIGRGYWRALALTAKGLWRALVYLTLALIWLARASGRGLRRLANPETRPGRLTGLFRLPGRLFRVVARRPTPATSATNFAPPSEAATTAPDVAAGNPAQVIAANPINLGPVAVKGSQWRLPSPELLAPAEARAQDDKSLRQLAAKIETALGDHGIDVEVADIKAGPRIVRFGLNPGWVEKKGRNDKGGGNGSTAVGRRRVQVGSILARERDLALAISAPSLRFDANAGEALLGLELPTPTPSKVTMREILDSPGFNRIWAKGGLPIALGADAGGDPVALDLAALPHMMIAGATGSGKSVCINSIIASFLLTKPPDQLRMVMVDPKQVELTPFNGIPHLIAPVIQDVEDVSPMLKGLVREMNRRYKQMSEINARNISGYNAKAKERLPYLTLVVDELADLMMVGGHEVEHSLVRLAQMGRAAGIHLILATQRPSKEVVTGLLKANIPAKVAFAVATQVNARVILDSVGAEKLLGKGDMLLDNNDSPQPRRVQGALALDEEIERLVGFWLEQKGPPLPSIVLDDGDEDEATDEDSVDAAILDKARELALRNPHLSSSLLERRLKIGGNLAARILELLEEEGLVIPR